MNAKKFLSYITVMCVVISIGMLVCCKSNDSADLMVYGKIFTSEGGQIVEAFAVKDGKYVYVGDKAGAEAYIEEGKTEVVDYTGKGLVILVVAMPMHTIRWAMPSSRQVQSWTEQTVWISSSRKSFLPQSRRQRTIRLMLCLAVAGT